MSHLTNLIPPRKKTKRRKNDISRPPNEPSDQAPMKPNVSFFCLFSPLLRERQKRRKNDMKIHKNWPILIVFARIWRLLKLHQNAPTLMVIQTQSFFKKWQIYTSVICVFSYITAKTPLVWSPKNRVHFYTGTGPYRCF